MVHSPNRAWPQAETVGSYICKCSCFNQKGELYEKDFHHHLYSELEKVVMAGHDNINGSTEKSSSSMDDLPTFNAENMQNNMKVILYSRTFMAIIGGVIAGILGLTSLTGFIFYFLVMAITSAALTAKAKFSIHSYFDSWNRLVLDGFFGGLMSFVLFWTFAYDIVHIF